MPTDKKNEQGVKAFDKSKDAAHSAGEKVKEAGQYIKDKTGESAPEIALGRL